MITSAQKPSLSHVCFPGQAKGPSKRLVGDKSSGRSERTGEPRRGPDTPRRAAPGAGSQTIGVGRYPVFFGGFQGIGRVQAVWEADLPNPRCGSLFLGTLFLVVLKGSVKGSR